VEKWVRNNCLLAVWWLCQLFCKLGYGGKVSRGLTRVYNLLCYKHGVSNHVSNMQLAKAPCKNWLNSNAMSNSHHYQVHTQHPDSTTRSGTHGQKNYWRILSEALSPPGTLLYNLLVPGIELQHIICVLYHMKCSVPMVGQIACIELCIELRICRIILIINNQRSTALRSHFQHTTMEINGQRRIGQWRLLTCDHGHTHTTNHFAHNLSSCISCYVLSSCVAISCIVF
jgi:hypothetical protein